MKVVEVGEEANLAMRLDGSLNTGREMLIIGVVQFTTQGERENGVGTRRELLDHGEVSKEVDNGGASGGSSAWPDCIHSGARTHRGNQIIQ